MAKPPMGTKVLEQARTYGIGNLRRHILLCAGPDCVASGEGEAAWAYLKKRIVELKLNIAPEMVYRTKCHCLRICMDGPIVVVYPEGVWYRLARPEVIERILQEHVLGGRVVEEFRIAVNPLPAGEK